MYVCIYTYIHAYILLWFGSNSPFLQEGAPYPDSSLPHRVAIPLAPSGTPATISTTLLLAAPARGSVAADGLQVTYRGTQTLVFGVYTFHFLVS